MDVNPTLSSNRHGDIIVGLQWSLKILTGGTTKSADTRWDTAKGQQGTSAVHDAGPVLSLSPPSSDIRRFEDDHERLQQITV